MRWSMMVMGLGLLGFLGGCVKPDAEKAKAKADAGVFEPLVLKEKPATPQSIIDVRDKAKDGDEVVLIGKVPPECTKPFFDTMAEFTLMDPKDLETPKVKEELECDDAAT